MENISFGPSSFERTNSLGEEALCSVVLPYVCMYYCLNILILARWLILDLHCLMQKDMDKNTFSLKVIKYITVCRDISQLIPTTIYKQIYIDSMDIIHSVMELGQILF